MAVRSNPSDPRPGTTRDTNPARESPENQPAEPENPRPMPNVKFRTSEYGIIEHESGEYEVVRHVDMLESEQDAKDVIDSLSN